MIETLDKGNENMVDASCMQSVPRCGLALAVLPARSSTLQ
jgi:hypothetical protein